MSLLAVLGNPIAHSLSPDIHAAFAEQADVAVSYERILVPEGGFQETAAAFFARGGRGCNVTVPCKRDAWRFVDQAGSDAGLAEAVNTISLLPDSGFRGDNTDGPGLIKDLTINLGWSLTGRRVLVLGAGGAVSGVLGNLLSEQPELVHVYNRTQTTAEALVSRYAEAFPGQVDALEKDALGDGYDVIVNGTSAGLAGQVIDLPPTIVADNSCCYDMVYGDKALGFLTWAKGLGAAAVSDGLGMLVEQAALSFHIWFEQEVDTAPVIRLLRRAD